MSLIGIPIGFYGYVFPGNINLMVVELYRSKKYKFLIFALALILIFESIYCIVSLSLLNTIKFDAHFYRIVEWLAYGLVAVMATWMIFENKKDARAAQKNTVNRGLLSIVLHPQQIPFWLIMGVFVNKYAPIAQDKSGLYHFVLFNAIGTLLAMVFYMIFGSKLFNYLKLNSSQINRLMGFVYLLLVTVKLCFPE